MINYILQSKSTILVVTVTLFLGLTAIKILGGDKIEDTTSDEELSVNTEHSVIRNIIAVSSQSGQIFCVEGASDTTIQLDKKFSIELKEASIKSFIMGLEKLGFDTQKYESGILLRSPKVLKITDNPLDHIVKEFKFSGNHDAFIEKISSVFPGLGPNVMKITGQFQTNDIYDIESKKPISIRKLLMLNAEKSGIMWKVVVKSKAPVHLLKDPETGKNKEVHGSRVDISFL